MTYLILGLVILVLLLIIWTRWDARKRIWDFVRHAHWEFHRHKVDTADAWHVRIGLPVLDIDSASGYHFDKIGIIWEFWKTCYCVHWVDEESGGTL